MHTQIYRYRLDGLSCQRFEVTPSELVELKTKHFNKLAHVNDEILEQTLFVNGKYIFLLLFCQYCQPQPNPFLGFGFNHHCELISIIMTKIYEIFFNLRQRVYLHFTRNCLHNLNTIRKTDPTAMLAAKRIFHKYRELLAHNGSDKMFERMIAYSQDLPDMPNNFYGGRYQSHDSVPILEDIHVKWVRFVFICLYLVYIGICLFVF